MHAVSNQGKGYLAGPMRGLPEHNYPAFHRYATELRAKGYEIVSPAEINSDWAQYDEKTRYRVCLARDLKALVDCDYLFIMTGWEQSIGAKLEHEVARVLGIQIVYLD